MTETILPENEAHWHSLRAKDLTSTDVAALFDCSPYLTEYELFVRKRDNLTVSFDPNPRTIWGNRLQESIGRGIAEDFGWKVRPMPEYMRDPELRLGSSFDFMIEESEHGPGLLEVKNVDALMFRDGWIVEGDSIEAPPHIELQLQHQLGISGLKFGAIGALVGGNRVIKIHREANPDVINAIRTKAAALWKRIETNDPPDLDFLKNSEFICSLYQNATAGKVLDFRKDKGIEDLVNEYRRFGEMEKEAYAQKQAIKAQLLVGLSDAEKAIGNGYSITAGITSGGPVSYVREPFRNFRVNFKKVK